MLSMGMIAAILQIAGYLVYLWYFYRKKVRPNAATWLMFTYGTALLAFLEYENGSPWQLLMLPAACAAMSIVVAAMCLRRDATDKTDRFEIAVFSVDLVLTALYAALTLTISGNFLPEWIVSIFLVAVNLTSVTCFMPMLRSTWQNPEREAALPWLVWTVAYAYLGMATWVIDGGKHPALLLYPVINAILHAAIALLSLRRWYAKTVYFGSDQKLYLAQSAIHGQGVYARHGYAAGDMIWRMSGRHVFHSRPQHEPNYVGIAPNLWIDPDPPIDTMNHSCAANAAFGRDLELIALRDIEPNEEVSFDYSTTEADPEWQLQCGCGAENCRQTLYAIQLSFADQPFPPAANPSMQEFWRNESEAAKRRSAFPQLGGAGKAAKKAGAKGKRDAQLVGKQTI